MVFSTTDPPHCLGYGSVHGFILIFLLFASFENFMVKHLQIFDGNKHNTIYDISCCAKTFADKNQGHVGIYRL